jgi:Zinc-binding dehydrogenase
VVIGTGRAADRDTALGLGVDALLDLQADKLEDAGEVDVVFDVIGGEILDRSTALVRAGGTLVTIARVPTVQPRNGRAILFVVEPDRSRLGELVQRLRDGRLKPIVGAVRPLAEAPAAFAPGRRTPARLSSGSPTADSRQWAIPRPGAACRRGLPSSSREGSLMPQPALAHPRHGPRGPLASGSPTRRFELVDPGEDCSCAGGVEEPWRGRSPRSPGEWTGIASTGLDRDV